MKVCRFCAEEIQDAAVVCKHCGRTLTADNPEAVFRGAELAMGFGAFCLVAALLYTGLEGAQPEPPVKAALPPPPVVISVPDEPALRLSPGGHFDARFVVDDPRRCVFRARVEGLEGGRRDVEVYLLDEDEYVNWRNEIQPYPLYASGRTVAATIEHQLPGMGRFHLLVSNRFSVFTPKTVKVENARVVCK
jgi:hypothetical protein